MSNSSEKILASLSYFSVFFAPLLFPIIVWIAAPRPVSTHAKRALLYHVLPWIFAIIAIGCFAAIGSTNGVTLALVSIIGIIAAIASLYYLIYNLYSGIKVLLVEQL